MVSYGTESAAMEMMPAAIGQRSDRTGGFCRSKLYDHVFETLAIVRLANGFANTYDEAYQTVRRQIGKTSPLVPDRIYLIFDGPDFFVAPSSACRRSCSNPDRRCYMSCFFDADRFSRCDRKPA